MSHRCLRGFVVLVGLGVLAPAGGCGSSTEEGTMVKVDKEKEDIMLKKMGDFHNKQGKPNKGGGG